MFDLKGTIPVVVKKEISLENLQGLLASAFEGGSNYWYHNLDVAQLPISMKESPEFWHTIVPLLDGGILTFLDIEGDRHTLARGDIEAGPVRYRVQGCGVGRRRRGRCLSTVLHLWRVGVRRLTLLTSTP